MHAGKARMTQKVSRVHKKKKKKNKSLKKPQKCPFTAGAC